MIKILHLHRQKGGNLPGTYLALGAAALLLVGAALLLARPGAQPVRISTAQPLYVTQAGVQGPASAAAGQPAAAEQPAADGQPAAALSASFYNFGRVGATEVVQEEFLLFNRGNAPLVIERAYTTCGCTSAEVSGGLIAPGEAGRVTLIFDAGFHPAAGQTVRRGLIIETNDPRRPQVEIWVQAEVAEK